MWDILLQNLPTVLLVAVAGIICGAELIKAIRVWKEAKKHRVDDIIEEQNKECAKGEIRNCRKNRRLWCE